MGRGDGSEKKVSGEGVLIDLACYRKEVVVLAELKDWT